MSPWSVEGPCTPDCVRETAPRVPLTETARRYAALTHTLIRTVAMGERLADPHTLRTQARAVLDALGVRLEAGPAPSEHTRGALLVANHISWLDVVALLAVEPVTVLAKREVGQWPVVGTLARRIGTRFIDRGAVRELPHTVDELTATLRSGRSVLVFPQATTWCAVSGGRFRRAAFQAAVDAGAPVRPMTVDYLQDGAPSTVAAFLGGDDFTTSLRRVAAARGLSVRVTAHPELRGTDRRTLAAEARAAVCGTRPPAHTEPYVPA
ncbi:lysophospholipid acyltransferase family protein [Streptomyces violascens]|uniref:1-acyl-sn-glycerol-3-phosphate acyltransferase n=1 Tax=Streptomyces violascens TaxID=67381 RepID=A0ABQ3QGR9_9ACTN|nr:lysophospholipid acyltransferase family protein [Streptomyces violascens]GGT90119.1 1-acyl-sn-glycerol-3-phosphate acyltransferase [Streptomyces violascens]GHI36449.1 1-acyl-sn-glycerol-3-phosphate acyltransferase [Streptomyces violascens]